MTRTDSQRDDYSASVEFYDAVPAYADREDTDFYTALAVESGGPVLELGCGTGRILVPIARSGISITGLDSSGTMLEICRRKLDRNLPAQVELVLSDMRDFDLCREYALVIAPFRSFQHLETAEDQLACLSSAVRHMRSGGTFVLDLFNPDMRRIMDISNSEEYGSEEPFMMPDGRRIMRRFRTVSTDLPEQVMDCEIIYHVQHPDRTIERRIHSFRMRWLFRWEAEHLLERAGLRVVEVAGNYHGGRFGEDWPGELILRAVKP